MPKRFARTKALAVLAILCLSAAGGRGAGADIYLTARELNAACLSDHDTETSYCLGYIAGVIDYHMMMQSLGTAPTIDFCLPDGVSVKQAAVVVLKYLRSAPQNADFVAAPTVPMALHMTYPCAPVVPKKRKRG